MTVVAQGPGNLGSGTRWGFSGVACGEAVNAVAALFFRMVNVRVTLPPGAVASSIAKFRTVQARKTRTFFSASVTEKGPLPPSGLL